MRYGTLSPIEQLIRALSDLQVRQAHGVDSYITLFYSRAREPSRRPCLRKRSGGLGGVFTGSLEVSSRISVIVDCQCVDAASVKASKHHAHMSLRVRILCVTSLEHDLPYEASNNDAYRVCTFFMPTTPY